MTAEVALRAMAVVLALLLARMTGNRVAAFAMGVLAGFAVFGSRVPSMPFAGGAALQAACLVALVAITLAVVSAFAAEATRASAEAGWREGIALASALLLPIFLAAALAGLFAGVPRRFEPLAVLGTLVVAVLVWAPAVLTERARVSRELVEEVTLGLLPEEDAIALRLPWRRGFEKRFGRPDERREYVRSALLLAVARHQQRHRTGEAERLRQLEVLTFRTRLKRTQDARASRFDVREPGEYGEPSTPETPGLP